MQHHLAHPKYRADIDGLRSIAVLSVITYHLSKIYLPGGFIGVDVFFVISGFVVTSSLAVSQEKRIDKFIAEFYARRLARIIPALALVLTLSAIAATLFIPPAWLSGLADDTGLYAFFGLSNWLLQNNTDAYFAPRAEFNPYIHTWSLGVEEQFYLIFPILYFIILSKQGKSIHRRLLLLLIPVLGAASFIGCIWATKNSPTDAFYSIIYRFWELAAGASLFIFGEHDNSKSTSRSVTSLASGILGILAISIGAIFADAQNFPYPWALLVVIGTVLIIRGRRPSPSDPIYTVLSSRLPVWIGKRSYSIYLWHWPIYVLFRWTVGIESISNQIIALIGTIAIASVAYKFIEMPLRHNAHIQKQRYSIQIALFLSIIVLGWFATKTIFEHRVKISLSAVTKNADEWYPDNTAIFTSNQDCKIEEQYIQIEYGSEIKFIPKCFSGQQHKKLFVFGDSHATAYTLMLRQFSGETGIETIVFSGPGCNYLNMVTPMDDRVCNDFWQKVKNIVLPQIVPGDFLFLPSLRLPKFVDQWAPTQVDMETLLFSDNAIEARVKATLEAIDWLKPFADKQVQIVFEAPKPIFKSPPFRCVDWFNSQNPICKDGLTQPRQYLERIRRPIVSSMLDVVGAIPGVQIWDPFPILCPSDTCSAFFDSHPLFFDGDHISAFGNKLVYSNFNSTLLESNYPVIHRHDN